MGIMVGILAVAALARIGVKVGPLYMDNISLNSAVKSAASRDFHALERSEIREILQKTFQINGIDVDPRDFDINKTARETSLSYNYEVRTNIFANMDVVVSFENFYSTAGQ